MAWATKTFEGTRHKDDCKMAFGRKDSTCPRCIELIDGAAPRAWAKFNDSMQADSVRKHFTSEKHLSGGCGVICTYGDW